MPDIDGYGVLGLTGVGGWMIVRTLFNSPLEFFPITVHWIVLEEYVSLKISEMAL